MTKVGLMGAQKIARGTFLEISHGNTLRYTFRDTDSVWPEMPEQSRLYLYSACAPLYKENRWSDSEDQVFQLKQTSMMSDIYWKKNLAHLLGTLLLQLKIFQWRTIFSFKVFSAKARNFIVSVFIFKGLIGGFRPG